MAMLIPIRDLNPTKRFPIVTVVLIALNALAFFATATSLVGVPADRTVLHYGAVPCDVLSRCPAISQQLQAAFPGRSPFLTVLTSMFMHSGLLHIGFNMLFLWVFGNNVEDRLGRIRFPLFYLATGFAAAYAHMTFAVATGSGAQVPIVGASGAISGVLGAYIVLWPRATIVSILPLGFFFTTIRTPAWVALGLWFVVQFLGGLAGLGATSGGGGVAYLAHIGGFIAGLLLILPFAIGRDTSVALGDHAA
jgi:membrane associated rhomboid family serine protease